MTPSKSFLLVLIMLVLWLVLSGCGDKGAIDRAKAARIEAETRAKLEAEAQAEERKQADWEATRQASNFGKAVFAAGMALVVTTGLGFLALILVVRAWQTSRAAVAYANDKTALAARLLHVDKDTMTWPALLESGAIHVIQTGEVLALGKPKPGTPQQIMGDVVLRGLALGTRGAKDIAKATDNAEAAQAIPELAAALPLIGGGPLADNGAYRDPLEDSHVG